MLLKHFFIKNISKLFKFCYLLPVGFEIFVNKFAFPYVKENSKEICQENPFLHFSEQS